LEFIVDVKSVDFVSFVGDFLYIKLKLHSLKQVFRLQLNTIRHITVNLYCLKCV